VLVGLEHDGILVAQQDLDAPVLRALKTAAAGAIGPEGRVFGWRHGGQHVPGVDELFHDARDAGQHLDGLVQAVRRDVGDGRFQFVQHQLHPELRGLVLDDEKRLVVVGPEPHLRVQNAVELEAVVIAHRGFEVAPEAP